LDSMPFAKLPPKFIKFLEENHLDRTIFDQIGNIPRFVRLKTGKTSVEALEKEFEGVEFFEGFTETPLPDFLELSSKVKIKPTKAFQEGRIYGIDIASGVAVRALDPKVGENILDLCCAPGAKLAYISDLVESCGYVTGVDVNQDRLNSCKSLARSYGLTNVRLFCADGTTFCELPSAISSPDLHDSLLTTKQLRRRNNKRKHEQLYGKNKRSKLSSGEVKAEVDGSIVKYDRVLVDAECTNDGSIKHIEKYFHTFGWESFEKNVLDPDRLASLQKLQRKLLENGFHQTKPGGYFVYSTCSLCRSQNEHIVEWFLSKYGSEACLKPIELSGFKYTRGDGMLQHVVRFDPLVSNTSGLFIAKFHKLKDS